MKDLLLGLSFVFVACLTNAQNLVYEGFEYPVGDSLPQHGWIGINSGDQILVTNGSVNYSGLAPSLGNKISFNFGGRDYQRTVTAQTSGIVYMSFVLQVTNIDSLTATGGYFSGLGAGTTLFGSSVWSKKNAGGTAFQLGINARTTAANTSYYATDMSLNTPIFVVVSYEIVSGTGNDIANIWINPSSSTFNGATAPTPTLTVTNTGGTDLTQIDRFFVRQANTTTTPFIDIDEFRVGTTWASVTPTTTGIKENLSVNSISLYPNPATNLVTISAKENLSQVQVFDIQGKKVMEYDFNGTSEIKLNVAELPEGFYNIVAYSTNGNVFNSKFEK